MTIHWTLVIIFGAVIIVLLKAEHWIRRRCQRRCSQCGSLRVRRIYRMHKDPDARVSANFLWRHYKTYVFTECKRCEHFKLAYGDDRCFSTPALRWRQIFHPGHFVADGDDGLNLLLERAGEPTRRPKIGHGPIPKIKLPDSSSVVQLFRLKR